MYDDFVARRPLLARFAAGDLLAKRGAALLRVTIYATARLSARVKWKMSMEQTEKHARRARSSRKTAGVSKVMRREPFSRTIAIVDAALRVWEAKHSQPSFQSVWQRSQKPSP